MADEVTDLQQTLAKYYNDCFMDDMFCWHDEGHKVRLSDIYVPIKWVEHQKTVERVTEIELKDYNEILNQVIRGEAGRKHEYILYKESLNFCILCTIIKLILL